MTQPSSFYQYVYSWQGLQYQELLTTLLNSCHSIMTRPSIAALTEDINYVIQQHNLDGYYRLEVCDNVYIEHFQHGRNVCYQGKRPQKGSPSNQIKVVELEHAIIFKMRFIHLYLTKDHTNTDLLEDTRDLWLLWLLHIESVCLQHALQSCYDTELTAEQYEHAHNLNYFVDLKISMTRLERSMKEIYSDYCEQVMSLLNMNEELEPAKRKSLLTCALSTHQGKLSSIIKQQLGLFLSSERLLQALN